MRSSMDYTSPNQDSKLSSSQIGEERITRDHDHNDHDNNTNTFITTTTTTTVTPTHHHHHHHNQHQALGLVPDPTATVTRYRECQKNHAAASGGHVLDGCGEFMPSSNDENAPGSLRCAACDCHRSFHRREIDGHFNPNNSRAKESQLTPRGNSTGTSVPLPHHHHQYPHHHHHRYHHHHNHQPVMMMAFGGAESSSDDLNDPTAGRLQMPVSSATKKRFRTKFNQDQKEKMSQLAERLGWRIQKHDEQEVQRFCSEVGVKRQVFKVWMHNNKQAMKKKDDHNNNNNDSDHQPNVNMPIT